MSFLKRKLLITLLFLPTFLYADGPLRSVVVFGNVKTDRKTIISIAKLPEKAFVDQKLVQEIDDRLTTCGLFKKVEVTKVTNKNGTADIRILVAEKQLWFAFPIVQAWSGRYNFGAAFGESNVLMQNARTILVGQWGNKNSRIFYALDAKNIASSNIAFRAWALARTDDVPIYSGATRVDELHYRDIAFSIRPGYQWTNEIQTAFDIKYRHVKFGDSNFVNLQRRKGHDISLAFDFNFNSMKRRDGFVAGNEVSIGYEFAEPRFGSNYSYHIEEISWRHGLKINAYLNYIFHISAAIADDTLPFHREFTQGGSSIRGFQDRQFRGDTEFRLKQDVLFPMWRHKKFSLFGLVFYDMGLIYEESNGIDRSAFNNGVGGGLRISLADILAPVFGFDFAYGVEDKSFETLFALGLVNF